MKCKRSTAQINMYIYVHINTQALHLVHCPAVWAKQCISASRRKHLDDASLAWPVRPRPRPLTAILTTRNLLWQWTPFDEGWIQKTSCEECQMFRNRHSLSGQSLTVNKFVGNLLGSTSLTKMQTAGGRTVHMPLLIVADRKIASHESYPAKHPFETWVC